MNKQIALAIMKAITPDVVYDCSIANEFTFIVNKLPTPVILTDKELIVHARNPFNSYFTKQFCISLADPNFIEECQNAIESAIELNKQYGSKIRYND